MDLRCIDIFKEVEVMSQYSASPRLVYFESLYHMFEYLRNNDMSRVVFDTFQPKVDESSFASGMMDWKDLYEKI